MYNLTTYEGNDNTNTSACAPCNGGIGTDGWVWGFGGDPLGSTNSVAAWAGTGAAHTTPFGYNGGGIVNWGLHLTSNGTAQISSQDSVNHYGIGADIDTAKGAWSDNALGGAQGWRHDLDFGLFKSDVGGTITLNAQGVNQTGTNFAFTIFKGMDTGTSYMHHGGWNAGNNNSGITADSLPISVSGLTVADIVAYSVGGASLSNINNISFSAEAGQIYQIFIGGYRNGAWYDTIDGYQLNVSQVPVPGAVWLFGTAIAGFLGLRRNKKLAA